MKQIVLLNIFYFQPILHFGPYAKKREEILAKQRLENGVCTPPKQGGIKKISEDECRISLTILLSVKCFIIPLTFIILNLNYYLIIFVTIILT